MPGHVEFMEQAIALATDNVLNGQGGPFGAVVVRDGAVVAKGANQVTASNDPTAHAEIVALRNACQVLGTFSLQNCDVYTSCEPCPMCLAAIYWADCRAIYFGNTTADAARAGFRDGWLYEQIRLAPPRRDLPSAQVLGAAAHNSFAAWEKSPYRVLY